MPSEAELKNKQNVIDSRAKCRLEPVCNMSPTTVEQTTFIASCANFDSRRVRIGKALAAMEGLSIMMEDFVVKLSSSKEKL
jgi:hypothetical protein